MHKHESDIRVKQIYGADGPTSVFMLSKPAKPTMKQQIMLDLKK